MVDDIDIVCALLQVDVLTAVPPFCPLTDPYRVKLWVICKWSC